MVNDNIPILVYDSENLELRTVWRFFEAHPTQLLKIEWEPEIAVGATVQAGQLLGKAIFYPQVPVPLNAPSGCDGEVDWIDSAPVYEDFVIKSIALLRLAVADSAT